LSLETHYPPGLCHFGFAERGIIALVNADKLRRILARVLDKNEFLSPCGIRSLCEQGDIQSPDEDIPPRRAQPSAGLRRF
jgi:hypothetical protein